jgi:hypothetical protein
MKSNNYIAVCPRMVKRYDQHYLLWRSGEPFIG